MTEYKEILSNWVKFTVVGDYVEGTLVSRELKNGTDPQGRPQTQMVYEILTEAGKFHNTIKRDGIKVPDTDNPVIIEKGEYYNVAKGSLDNAMKKIKIGQKVKFLFDSVVESKDKMKNDFKLVKVYGGPMDEQWLAENKNSQYQEVDLGNGASITGKVVESEIDVKNLPFD